MPRPTVFPTHAAHIAAILLILLLDVAPTAAAFAQRGTESAGREESVRAAELARRDALLAADTVALSRLVATEFYEISRVGLVRPRVANMREIATGTLKLLTVSYDSTVVHVYGDVAVLSAIADNTGTFQGIPFSGKIRYTRVFVWRDGRWQAVMMQHTPMS
jgi:hypothetical protein